jgi:Ca-activated chloride channel family protein
VNAALLDRLSESTRALSAYVRPAEDIEAKVSGLFSKIANPVLSDLRLVTTGSVRLSEVYPTQLPDLFHGGQLVVMGRYSGQGASAIKLTGKLGGKTKEFVYETTFPERTGDGREFVEHLWARRKVGYLLDQIRANGERPELVQEVTALAKRYGITTQYTSYLIVPDAPTPTAPGGVVRRAPGRGAGGGKSGAAPKAMSKATGGWKAKDVTEFARKVNSNPGDLAKNRMTFETRQLLLQAADGKKLDPSEKKALEDTKDRLDTYHRARAALKGRRTSEVQTGRLGVNVAVEVEQLRNQTQLEQTAQRMVNGRNLMEVGGVWIDEGFGAKTKAVTVKAQSNAYFRILERQKVAQKVFQLGNNLVWVTPSGTALVIDASNGKAEMTDSEIDKLFVARK